MARGIEVFGRNATVVEFGPAERGPRTPALGAGALLLAVAAVAALVAAVIERGELFAWIALGVSAAAVLLGLAALLTGRGRLTGFAAVIIGAFASPWVLTGLLEWAAGFVE